MLSFVTNIGLLLNSASSITLVHLKVNGVPLIKSEPNSRKLLLRTSTYLSLFFDISFSFPVYVKYGVCFATETSLKSLKLLYCSNLISSNSKCFLNESVTGIKVQLSAEGTSPFKYLFLKSLNINELIIYPIFQDNLLNLYY